MGVKCVYITIKHNYEKLLFLRHILFGIAHVRFV